MKKALSFLLCLLLVLSALPLSAAPALADDGGADEIILIGEDGHIIILSGSEAREWSKSARDPSAATYGYWEYTVANGQATVTGYTGSESSVKIPSTLGNCPVRVIAGNAFASNTTMKSVTIPETVTTIEALAFNSCTSLTSFSVASGNQNYSQISGVLFNKAGTELVRYPGGKSGSYSIPSGVTAIADYAFALCINLTGITIRNSVKSIGGYAFIGCSSLPSMTIPDSVTSIGAGLVSYCENLTALSVASSNPSYKSVDNVVFTKDGTELVCCAGGAKSSCQIPAGVCSVGSAAFYGCSLLTSVTFTNSVTRIGNNAFSGCDSLTDVYFSGTRAQWNAIEIGGNNDPLLNATLHLSTPLSISTLKASKTSAVTGDSITWTAAATGGTGTLKYCFYIYNGSSLVQKGSYGTAKTVSYAPDTAGTWKVKVFVKDGGGTTVSKTGGDVTVTAPAAPLSISTLKASRTSAETGDSITWTAAATGGTGTLKYCFYIYKDTTVVFKGSYGTAKTCTYTPDAAGSYSAKVFVKDGAGTTASKTGGAVTVTVPVPPLSISTLKANAASTTTGNPITWTAAATGGTGTLKYCFYIYKDSAVVYKGSYGTAKTCTYTPDAAGSYSAKVFVKDGAGTTVSKTGGAVTVTVPVAPLTISSLKANVASTTTGNTITWTAAATGGTGTLRYCFYIYNGSTLVQKGTYSTAKTVSYAPAAAGTWKVKVYVKDGAGTTVTMTGGDVTVTVPVSPLTVSTLKASKTSAETGETITWTAAATGGTGTLRYCFRIYNGSTQVYSGAYSTAKTVSYTPNGPGTWKVRVYVKDGAGTTVSKLGGAVTVTVPPITITSFTVNRTSAEIGNVITWTASATGGTGTLNYCFNIRKDDTVILATAYTAQNYYNYVPSEAGIYTATVIVKGDDVNSYALQTSDEVFVASPAADFTYEVTDGKAKVTGYTGSGGAVAIPSTLGGYPVTEIAQNAFTSSDLTNVTIPNSVTSIGLEAFSHCGSLTSATIPNSVTNIGRSAFYYCTSLTSIEVSSGNGAYKDINGVLFNKAGTLLHTYPAGKSGSYVIPDGVNNLGYSAFAGSKTLTNITIPDSVTIIGHYVFYGCSGLTSVTIPDSVTTIGYEAFAYCIGLTSVMIPDSVRSINGNAFKSCSGLTSIIVASGNTEYKAVNGVLFDKTGTFLITYPAGKSGSYVIPNGVMDIEDCAFYGCNGLTSVTISNGVTDIWSEAFFGCSALTIVTIPDSVTGIYDYAFFNCSALTDIYYTGTASQWSAIAIEDGNDPLLNASLHYV